VERKGKPFEVTKIKKKKKEGKAVKRRFSIERI